MDLLHSFEVSRQAGDVARAMTGSLYERMRAYMAAGGVLAGGAGTNVNSVATLSGFFKVVYAKTVKQAVPDNCKLQKELIEFSEPVQQVGEQYVQPVTLKMPHGVTYASNNQDAFALNPPKAGLTQKAIVTANQMVIRDTISYEAASLAVDSETSFGKVTAHVVKRMLEEARIRLEIALLYGGGPSPSTLSTGLGQVSATFTAGANGTVTVLLSEYATGIWAGLEGAVVDFWNAAGTVLRGSATVVSVNPDTQVITFDNVPALTGSNTLGAGDQMWFNGSRGNTMNGIHEIMANAATMFNISALTFNQWKANNITLSAAVITFAVAMQLVEKCVNKGLMGDAVLLLNSGAFRNLMTTEASLRRYNWGYDGKVFEEGAEEVKFHGQNGVLTIIPHPFVKQGYAYLLKPEDWLRVGSVDWTFEMPGSERGRFFRDLENNAGYELRLYTNQAAFCEIPGHQGYVSGIQNS